MLSVIAGAQRFAHANQLRADRALHALLGLKRFPSDVECRIDELENELSADHFCLRSFFATESAFLAVVFSFNLLSEFQRTIGPALKSYKQAPSCVSRSLFAARRREGFECGTRVQRKSSGIPP
jgi:hypothetical protein